MRRLLCCLAAAGCASCAPPLAKLPSGPGAPASDGPEVLQAAVAACDHVSTLTAEIAVSGSAGGRRLRTRLLAGVAAPASVRLEAAAPFGAPLFVFVARDGEATLLLPRDERVLSHGRPDAVLEAVAGVPLDAAALRRVLAGCVDAPRAPATKSFGSDWRAASDSSIDLYVHRDAAGKWRLVAAMRHADGATAWRADFADFQNDLPRTIRLSSPGSDRFDLRLKISQVEIDTPLRQEAFELRVPPGTSPISLDELRESGPLGRSPSSRARDTNAR
jgi:hypothetical protein